MAKQLNVNLVFNANTQQAKQQMASLQTSVNQLQNTLNSQISMTGMTKELSKAQGAVSSLKANLNSAFNVDTGKLDLTRFSANLQRSGMTLKQYRDSLASIGVQGQQAFNQLTNSIVQGQMPLQKTNNLLTNMMTTFGSSIKWSLAYGAINKISQGFQNAFQYAQDLNASLTNIRVVTGKSSAEMANFAEKANRAAKALGTTTTAYTDAALIYYQQGLEGKAVEERAEATLKLANVTGQSAEIVSDQMTAVWNNFYDGSKSLEYYADVLTALGAATASSTDEISDGLEKFAAIAETVGLSYEYATTALATVTAETRQSADVVGTAFKTLFARIQDLELGKTLEDGTSLGSYSEALAKVGVNIKDANGDLKDMDQILNEMGERWDTLNQAQQVALAKSVAGIRQYTQLIALMDNWDSFEANLTVAQTSEGTLTEQQDIWAESWEAASNRVTASAEELYSLLLNDKFFIDLNNMFADLLSVTTDFVDAIGGLKTLLPLIAGWMMQAFGPTIISSITNFKNNLMGPSKAQQAQAAGLKTEALRLNSQMAGESSSYGVQAKHTNAQNTEKIYKKIEGIERRLTEEENQQLQFEIDRNREIQKALEMRAQELDLLKQTQNQGNNQATLNKNRILDMVGDNEKNKETMTDAMDDMHKHQTAAAEAQVAQDQFNNTDFRDQDARTKASKDLLAKYDKMDKGVMKKAITTSNYKELSKFAAGGGTSAEFAKLQESLQGINLESAQMTQNLQTGERALTECGLSTEEAKNFMNQYATGLQDGAHASARMETATNNYNKAQKTAATSTKKTILAIEGLSKIKPAEIFMGIASGVASMTAALSMGYSGIQNIVNMFESGEHSLGGWLGALSSIAFAIPMLSSGFSTFGDTLRRIIIQQTLETEATKKNTKEKIINAAVSEVNEEQSDDSQQENIESTATIKMETRALRELNAEELKNLGLKKLNGRQGYGRIDGKQFSNGKTRISGKTTVGDLNNGLPGNTPKTKVGQNFKTGGQGIGTFFKTNGAAIGQFAAGAGIALVGIAAIIGGITLMVKGFNKHNEVAKTAAKNAAAVKKEYEGIVAEVNKFNDNVSKYDEANKKVNSLVKGTMEYKQALFEANQVAMDLISSNKVLQEPGAYEVVNGEIIIDDKALEKAQKAQLQKQQNALAVSNIAQIESKQAQYEAKKVETLKDVKSSGDYDENAAWGIGGGVVGGIAGGILAAGAVNGWNPVGWALLAAGALTVVGSAIAGAAVGDDEEAEHEATDHLAEQYEENPDMFASKDRLREALGPEFEHLADSMWENRESMEELIRSNHELKMQEELLAHQIAQSIVDSKYSDVDNRAKDAATTSVQKLVNSDEIKTARDDLYEEIKGQDGLLEDLYNYFHKDEGITVDNKTGDKAVITKADGTTEDTTQSAIAQSVVSSLQQAITQGDASTVNQLMSIVKNADGVSEGNENDIKNLLDKFEISEEAKAAIEQIERQSATLDEIEIFSKGKGDVNHSKILNSIAAAKDDPESIDLSYLTREELKALQDNLSNFDAQTGIILNEGIRSYDEKRKRANLKASKEFDEMAKESADRAKAMSEAQINDSEFKAFAETISATYGVGIETAEELAEANLKVKNGLTDLQETYKTYGQYLDKSYRGTLQYSKGIAAVQNDLKTWLGVSFDTQTIEQNLPTIRAALDGDVEAIDKLYELATRETVIEFDLPTAEENKALSLLNNWQNENIEIGMSLNTSEAARSLGLFYNSLIKAGLISTEEAQSALEGMGYDVATSAGTSDSGQSVRLIDLNYTTYQGSFSDRAIDFMPTDTETPEEKQKRMKNIEEEAKRYHEINEILNDIERKLNDIAEAQKQAFGQKRLDLMQDELKLYEKQLAAQHRLYAETEAYLQRDKTRLDAFGAEYDEEGRISNYNTLYENEVAKYNKAMESSDEKVREKAETRWKEFTKAVTNYEETLNKLEEEGSKKIAIQALILQKQLESIDYAVNVKLKVDDRQLKRLERLLKNLEDDAFDGADKMALFTRQIETGMSKIEKYSSGIKTTLATAGVKPEDIEAYMAGNGEVLKDYDLSDAVITQLENYSDKMLDTFDNMKEAEKNLMDQVMKTFDGLKAKFEELIQVFDSVNNLTEAYQNIIDLLGKGRLGLSDAILKDINKAKSTIAEASLTGAIASAEFTRTAIEKEKDRLAKATTKDQKDKIQKEIDKLDATFLKDIINVGTAWSETLEQITNTFKDNLNIIIDTFEDKIAGAQHKTLEALSQGFEHQQSLADQYVEDYKRIYELSKLNRDITTSLNTTKSAKGQMLLRDLQAEITEYQKTGKQMSEYELNNLRKKYDLKLAEIALDEARDAKSQVRLRRDSEGNFGYVYTADETKIAEAEQQYEDRLYSMQETNDNYLEELQSKIINNRKQLIEELRNLDISDYANAEEFYAARNEVITRYKNQERYLLAEMQRVLSNNQNLYNTDWRKYSEATGYKMSANTKWEIDFNDTVLAIETGYDNMETFIQGFNDALGSDTDPTTLLGASAQAYQNWEFEIDRVLGLGKEAMEKFVEAANGNLNTNPDSASNAATTFEAHLQEVFFGVGGTAEKPTGGIIGMINATIGKLGDLALSAPTEFEKVLTAAAEFAKKVKPHLDNVETEVTDIDEALLTLVDLKTQTINIETSAGNTQTILEDINEQLELIKENKIQEIKITTTYEDDKPKKPVVTPTSSPNLVVSYDVRDGVKHYTLKSGAVYKATDVTFEKGETRGVGGVAIIKKNAKSVVVGAQSQFVPSTKAQTDTNVWHSRAKGSIGKESYTIVKSEGIEYVFVNNAWYKVSELGAKKDSILVTNNGKNHLVGTQYYVQKGQLSYSKQFDTGGYTGSWGPEGRMAMLHQKELVLNAADTENFLAAVKIVRSMADMLDANAAVARQGLAGAVAATIKPANDVIEQNVTIHAEFPNATDHNEIEEAFGNLVNLASQYANRKN